tara:strand:- start:13790 stop:14128 length:339 start_codon:yes stop_codon:yes gene_type:complete
MKLLAKDLIQINKAITDINVDLTWDHGEGVYHEPSEQFESNGFLVVFHLVVNGSSYKMPTNGFMEEDVWSDPKFSTCVSNIRVYNDEGHKLDLLAKHIRSLEHNILKNLYPS